ncbi:tRNA 2-selenouridine(34) synthase MnmH [Mucilaginibacter gotjawali]|uniref:tRNA 2-selenouridine synthase n=2 Tax=Mucilaginibacter gotjawali TaxID=1550579 RepID=A0A839SNA4_9SPHI|nr:tRNA 2-selenouridine(34) synthase MnmH [Mucilaginibacter gotjawali]MBB3057877.1 tRNA 2-selenouridine synthase [Mucilaginibacter gotjawali]BAU52351.1 tRNA 2-selenouridine synthase [Mucilaginibacter gotjawali]
MIKNTGINTFLQLDSNIPVVDVRTPAEFAQGHICGAHNIPLFSNEERVQVGTTYKQVGREDAILLGFDLTGSKWSGFIKQALEIAPNKKIAVHCWRGGMRSGAMAWCLDLYGFDVYLLTGGYKHYRRRTLDTFAEKFNIRVLGGLTGSGKTKVLHQLKALGEQVIDLEGLAQHQGSAFGSMNGLEQPTQEQFENNLAAVLRFLDRERPVWVEDESITIGKRFIPNGLFHQMRDAPITVLKVPPEARVDFLVGEYGVLNKDFLKECTQKIWKRLGPEQTKNAIIAIDEDRIADFIRTVLVYYDKTYRNGLSKRDQAKITEINADSADALANARLIMALENKLK